MAGKSLDTLVSSMFGVQVRSQNSSFSAGLAVLRLLQHNANRISLTIFNLSANSVYISPTPDVSASNGAYLASNGGFVTLQWDRDFQLVANEWYVIATGAASSLYILENISLN
jgi:hypothetical protein